MTCAMCDVYAEEMSELCQVVAEYLVGKLDAKSAMEQVRQAVEDYAEPTTPDLRETLGFGESKCPKCSGLRSYGVGACPECTGTGVSKAREEA